MPLSSWNSKEKVRVRPGPRDVIEVSASIFFPLLVVMKASRPPIGIAASFVISMVTNRTSSSSSSISILTDVRRASREAVRALCSSLICSPACHSTKPYFNSTQPQAGFGRQRPVNGCNGVVCFVDRSAVLAFFGTSSNHISKAEP